MKMIEDTWKEIQRVIELSRGQMAGQTLSELEEHIYRSEEIRHNPQYGWSWRAAAEIVNFTARLEQEKQNEQLKSKQPTTGSDRQDDRRSSGGGPS